MADEAGAGRVLQKRLNMLQHALLCAYAVSLPLSMTASWALLTAGIVCSVIELLLIPVLVREPHSRLCMGKPGRDERCDPSSWRSLIAMPLMPALLALVLAIAVSGYGNGGLREALLSIVKLHGLLAFFWAAYVVARNRSSAVASLQLLLCTAAVAGAWGFIQQRFNIHFGFQYLQATGFLGDPMAFAGQMQICSMLALALVLPVLRRSWFSVVQRLQIVQRIPGPGRSMPSPLQLFNTLCSPNMSPLVKKCLLLFLVVAFNIIGLLFAGERGAWLGGLAGALCLAGLYSWRTMLKTCIVMAALSLISWYTVPLVHTRVQSMLSPQTDVSTHARLEVWQVAINEWHKSPFIGVGFLKFPHLSHPEAIVPGKSKDLNHAHNNYLQFLSTTGALGLFTYLWLCFAQLRQSYMVIRKGRTEGDEFAVALGRGTFSAMFALMLSGIFEFNFGTAQVRLAQWFILGLLAVRNAPGSSLLLSAEELEADEGQNDHDNRYSNGVEKVDSPASLDIKV